ncbi:MAG: hypothetical protein Ct9H90mP2_07940 [Dehalococcoidia bacterium]|nr:MAG: hypothetical protein Ct9H90mP2_07940 [Dehalococcoidia bacterium]
MFHTKKWSRLIRKYSRCSTEVVIVDADSGAMAVKNLMNLLC